MSDKMNLGDAMLELTPDQLESFAGGAYTNEQAAQLRGILAAAKKMGKTKDEVLGMVPGFFAMLSSQYPEVTLAEVNAYINANWDSL